MNLREEWEKELNDLPLGTGGFSAETAQKVKDRVAGGYRKRRRRLIAALSFSVVFLLLGVSFLWSPSIQEKTAYEKIPQDDQKEVKLKVQYWDTGSFLSQVGYAYMKKYPNTSFTVAASPRSGDIESYIKWVKEQNPDVLQIPLEYIDDLANEGMILPLDDWMERDRGEMGRMHQPVIDLLREAGNGKLYGFANQFDVRALVYNKALFREKGIDPPTDNMTWDEVLQLASRFAGDTKDGQPLYGLSFGWRFHPSQAIRNVGFGEGLRILGPYGRPSLDTPSWHQVWNKVLQGMRDGSISDEGAQYDASSWNFTDMLTGNPFLQDRAAMSIQGFGDWRAQKEAVNTGRSGGDWAAVALPSSSGLVHDYHLPFIYAINANASNADQAWQFVRYLMSEEWAARSMQDNPALYTVRPDMPNMSRELVDAYYRANPDVRFIVENAESYQQPEYRAAVQTWQNTGPLLSSKVLNGTITIDQALAELQKEAETAVQALLDQAK